MANGAGQVGVGGWSRSGYFVKRGEWYFFPGRSTSNALNDILLLYVFSATSTI